MTPGAAVAAAAFFSQKSSELMASTTNQSSPLQSSPNHLQANQQTNTDTNGGDSKKRSSPSFSAAMDFLSFKWFFKRKTSNKKQTSAAGNNETNETQQAAAIATTISNPPTTDTQFDSCCGQSETCAHVNLRPSYSFDDVDKFLKKPYITKLKMKTSDPYESNSTVRLKGKASLTRMSTTSIIERRVHLRENTNLCPLCLTVVVKCETHSIYSCGCVFCKQCLSQYLTVNIKENNGVKFLNCPDANCPALQRNSKSKNGFKSNLISRTEIEMLVEKPVFELYRKFKLDWEVDSDPNRTWCPTPNCDYICVITKPTITSLNSSSSLCSSTSTATKSKDKAYPFYCERCDQTFCSRCRKLWHPFYPCQLESEDSDLMLMLQRSANTLQCEIKRCPRCSVWIERDNGCAQMMCRKCKHVFCWFCLQSLEDDFLLRHYDKGPCKNKLGHSRASVIWHRTQVIGIFAGFGILLLLASPLFLVAAPCILCCNCCCSSTCKYLEDVDAETEKDGQMSVSNSSIDDDPFFSGKRHTDKRL
ncbi:putative E3 ubiquitin-protein ligase RNF144A-B-like protein [Dinothrombium tinctorium]|uniref:RBR-type E3 ubiquitin transferase n=1 Tax=Dinothrombium tinctorium TaxID=1965070 RepID=A0A443QFD7_9ACAR|nr:putative E3 ubiquitin-protein ligase RNF144A-B-like protein [Dinothrombium tinctorium]